MLYHLVLLFIGHSAGWGFPGGRPRRPPVFPSLPSMNELAAAGGYPATNYEVITEDGYSLWLFRLGSNPGPPVLMQHGLTVAGDQWITRGPGRDLAFILLEQGFDVWISNQRGTVFNEYSLKYPKSDPRFWNFSIHEAGYYDEPAFINTILDVRGEDQLFYIGHSLGTTVFLVMCSTRPEYNKKIRAAVFLSPIAYTAFPDEQTPTIRWLQENADFLYKWVKIAGITEVGGRTEESINSIRKLCVENKKTSRLCLDLAGILSGEDRTNLDMDEWNFFVPFFSAGQSLNTFYHVGQFFQTGEFKQLDLGAEENLRRYGNNRPPFYDLSQVTSPVAIFWGYNDILTSERSVNMLASQLPNLIFSKPVPYPKFNHIDMYIGDNANKVLFPDVVSILKKMSKDEFSSSREKTHHSDAGEKSYPKTKDEPRSCNEELCSHGRGTVEPTEYQPRLYHKDETYSFSKEEQYSHAKANPDSQTEGED